MRASLLVGLLWLIATAQFVVAEPIPWFPSEGGNGHFYELVVPPGGTTWTMAQSAAEKCEFLGLPGHLVTIGNEAEWDFITRSFPHNGTWIGLTDSGVEGDFTWVTGEPVGFSAWNYLEPNDANEAEDYAYYELAPEGWGWSDLSNRRTVYGAEMPLAYLMEYPSKTLLGDFTRDNVLDTADINLLAKQTATGHYDPLFDLTGDGQLDFRDRVTWVEKARDTTMGDANLDGQFDSGDLVQVFIGGEYDDGVAMNSTWSEGDWSGDFEFDSRDILVAFQAGGYRVDSSPFIPITAVPEPTASRLLWLGWLIYFFRPDVRRWK